MWGYGPTTRPSFIVPLFLPISFLAGAIGIYYNRIITNFLKEKKKKKRMKNFKEKKN